MKSAYAAKCIQEEMINYSGSYNRGVKRADFLVLREIKAPSVLLEVGFLSNPSDAALLKDSNYRTRVVNGIVQGIYRFYSIYY
ncbi:hypothetical protein AZF37_02500 [endosymbiont 'TC1' of Trimyema compressum]|nr:hypothetical protein AZF37_02500 [endosymbiont 'TC1' of Trimyema compressum]